MTSYKRGDVILVNFIFADESGMKKRPAVVISSDLYNKQRREAIISAVTSRTDRILIGDHFIDDWQGAGLISPSVATGIIRTVNQGMVNRKLGTMPYPDMQAITSNLADVLATR